MLNAFSLNVVWNWSIIAQVIEYISRMGRSTLTANISSRNIQTHLTVHKFSIQAVSNTFLRFAVALRIWRFWMCSLANAVAYEHLTRSLFDRFFFIVAKRWLRQRRRRLLWLLLALCSIDSAAAVNSAAIVIVAAGS